MAIMPRARKNIVRGKQTRKALLAETVIRSVIPTRVGRRVGKHKAIEAGRFRTPFGRRVTGVRAIGRF